MFCLLYPISRHGLKKITPILFLNGKLQKTAVNQPNFWVLYHNAGNRNRCFYLSTGDGIRQRTVCMKQSTIKTEYVACNKSNSHITTYKDIRKWGVKYRIPYHHLYYDLTFYSIHFIQSFRIAALPEYFEIIPPPRQRCNM
jgi:hypothetical protein